MKQVVKAARNPILGGTPGSRGPVGLGFVLVFQTLSTEYFAF